MTAARPKLIIEVLSPNSRDTDVFNKLDEYKGAASMDYVVLIEPNEAWPSVWSKDEMTAGLKSALKA